MNFFTLNREISLRWLLKAVIFFLSTSASPAQPRALVSGAVSSDPWTKPL